MALKPLVPKADIGTAFPPNPDWEPPVPIVPFGTSVGGGGGGGITPTGMPVPILPPSSPTGTAAIGSGGGGITPPTDVGNASSALREIFAPAATERALSPTVASVPAPVESTALAASPEAAAASSSSRRSGGGTGTWRGIDRWLATLMNMFVNDSGMGADLKSDLRNEATQTSKFRERDRIMRRADDFAARGLFGSGLRKDAVMGIEGEESVALQGALNQIEFKDAEMRAQGLRDSIQVLNAMIAKKLGQGNLNIQREMMALERAKHELSLAMFAHQQNMDFLDRVNPPPPPPPIPDPNPLVVDSPPIAGGSGGGPGGRPSDWRP